jgi:uncharacterized protein YjiS (DUF1127 family)
MHAASTSTRTQTDARRSRATQPQIPFTQRMRIHRLIDALQSLDDRTLSQIGIARDEIERFAHAEVAHNL